MEFQALGPVEVLGPNGRIRPRGDRQTTLLATLLVTHGRTIPAVELATQIWGEDAIATDGADVVLNRLQVHVHRLRALLRDQDGADRIRHDGDGYCLDLTADGFDVLDFDAAARSCLEPGASTDLRLALAGQALARWRGIPYDGADAPILTGERERLERLRLAVRIAGGEAALELGRHGEVADDLLSLSREQPYHEGAHALAMRALAGAGRRAEALEVFQWVRGVLAEELGVDPGAALRRLHEKVLLGEDVDSSASGAAAAEGDHAELESSPEMMTPPPLLSGGLVGRDSELAVLDDLLLADGHPPPVAVVGTAGVGKTALVVEWARRNADRFPDGVLYCDLRGFSDAPPRSAQSVLPIFLRSLGASPSPEDDPGELFRAVAARRRVLVVLDNAASVDHVHPMLASGSGVRTVVTSRHSLSGLRALAGVEVLGLAPLQTADAASLLRDASIDLTPAVTEELAERCAGLPLALRIVAEQLRVRTGDAAGLLGELAVDNSPLESLDLGDTRSSVRTVLSWSMANLCPAEQQIFVVVGLLAAPADAEAIAAAADLDRAVAQRALDGLVRAHLVERRADGCYHQHDLLRALAREGTDGRLPTAARRRLADHLLSRTLEARSLTPPPEVTVRRRDGWEPPPAVQPPLADAAAAYRWGVRNEPLLTRTDYADPLTLVYVARALSSRIINSAGDPATVEFFEHAVELAAEHGSVDDELLLGRVLGTLLSHHGRYGEGLERLRRTQERAFESEQWRHAAVTANNRAIQVRNSGDSSGAVELQRQAIGMLELSEDARITDRLIMGANLIELLVEDGQHATGLELVPKLLDLDPDRTAPGIANVLQAMGLAHVAAGDVDEAEQVAHTTLAILAPLGPVGDRQRSDAMVVLGRVHVARGDAAAGLAELEKAALIKHRVASPLQRAELLWECAAAAQQAGQQAVARSHRLEARALAQMAGVKGEPR